MTIEKLNELIDVKESELEGLKLLAEKMGGNKKPTAKADSKKKKAADKDADTDDYEGMTSKNLYKLCCERGLSSKCKERNKAYLINVLREADTGTDAPEDDAEDWGEEEEEQATNPYEGKKASELYKMCVERKIKTKKQLKAEAYVKLLVKYDEEQAKADAEDDADDWGEDEEDDWEV